MKTIIISVLASVVASTAHAQLVHQFNSPSFLVDRATAITC
jgi:hypothetical protein